MNASRSIICTEHRLARFVAWTKAMLAWIAMLLVSPDPPRARRRHIRRRYAFADLDRMTRHLRDLVIIRAAQIARLRPRRASPWRDFAPSGFTKRTRTRALRRSCAGAWLSRRLRSRGGAGERIAHLLAALAELDVLAARLARRLERGLTRLCPIVLTHAPREAARSLATPAPCADNTS